MIAAHEDWLSVNEGAQKASDVILATHIFQLSTVQRMATHQAAG